MMLSYLFFDTQVGPIKSLSQFPGRVNCAVTGFPCSLTFLYLQAIAHGASAAGNIIAEFMISFQLLVKNPIS